MAQQFEITAEDSKKAKIPHDLLLINLIFNHVLVFVACLTTGVLIDYIAIVPITSVLLLITIFIGAHRAKSKASWYVNGHWQLCAKRSFIFLIMLTIVGSVFLLLYWLSNGDLKPQHWALGGAAALPVMVTVLALIIMESEALHHAKIGILPNWVKEKFPLNSLEPVAEEQGISQNEKVVNV
ncbi:MAG: hypothetical protein KAS02_03035 [Candidatus Pacebacteria bacterium]|nr:hypothetical protein [Candidatus Paceibacterota bacterium]